MKGLSFALAIVLQSWWHPARLHPQQPRCRQKTGCSPHHPGLPQGARGMANLRPHHLPTLYLCCSEPLHQCQPEYPCCLMTEVVCACWGLQLAPTSQWQNRWVACPAAEMTTEMVV